MAPHAFDEAAWQARVQAAKVSDLYAPHRTADGAFFNPWQVMDSSFSRVLRWRFSRNSVGPMPPEMDRAPKVANDGAYLGDPAAPDSVTHVGHATFAVQLSGQVVLTDPHFSASALVVERLVEPGIGLDKVPEDCVALLSHNHYDHMDRTTVGMLGKGVKWLCPLGLKDALGGMGAGEVIELDWWQSTEVDGTKFTCLPTQHWSLRIFEDRNISLWCCWLIERGDRRVLFGGDSGYFKGFAEFGRRWPKMDLAIIPIGAYMPRWFMHYAHMDIHEALRAFDDLGAQRMAPMQWGVFKLGDGPAAWPAYELQEALKRRGDLAAKVHTLPVGGRLML